MNFGKFLVLPLFLALCACGGGNGDSINSSFKGEVSVNGQIYQCPTQKTYDACSNSTNRDCSGCTTNNSTPNGAVITANCTAPSATAYQVSQDGCIVNLSSGKQTGACVSGILKLVSGTGFTKAQVTSQGASFSSGATINGVTIKCAS